MGLQVLDHTAARMASLHERFYYADDVDDLLARIRAAAEVERLAYWEWYHLPIDGPTGPRNRAWQDARAALDALLSQEVE